MKLNKSQVSALAKSIHDDLVKKSVIEKRKQITELGIEEKAKELMSKIKKIDEQTADYLRTLYRNESASLKSCKEFLSQNVIIPPVIDQYSIESKIVLATIDAKDLDELKKAVLQSLK